MGLTSFEQGWKTARAEILIREPEAQRFRMGNEPGTPTAGGRLFRQNRVHTQLNQHRPATAGRLPLPPHCRPKTSPNPPSQIDQHAWCFAETEVAPPTPHIRSQRRHRCPQIHTLGLPRDFPDSLLEP